MNKPPAILHCKTFWSEPKQRFKRMKAPGRSRKRPAGGWIYDLVGLGKAINLCQKKCQVKFNAPGAGYVRYCEVTGYDHCISTCDGCKETYVKCNTYLIRKTNSL